MREQSQNNHAPRSIEQFRQEQYETWTELKLACKHDDVSREIIWWEYALYEIYWCLAASYKHVHFLVFKLFGRANEARSIANSLEAGEVIHRPLRFNDWDVERMIIEYRYIAHIYEYYGRLLNEQVQDHALAWVCPGMKVICEGCYNLLPNDEKLAFAIVDVSYYTDGEAVICADCEEQILPDTPEWLARNPQS